MSTVDYTIRLGCWFQQNSCSPITKQGTCGSVVVIGNSGHRFGSYDNHLFIATSLNECCSLGQCKNKATAGCTQIPTIGILQATILYNHGCSSRKDIIRGVC